jgi:hypothetical protein
MATTAKPIDFLVTGMRDSSGNAVASGKVRWYNPGTLVAAVAYSDAACTTPITAPLTLDAGGRGTIYCLEPVRVIVKDSTESTTYYDDIAPLQRHDSVYITHPSINSGTETTLETVLGTLATNLGTNFQYKESSGATATNYSTWLGQFAVSVKDFGAAGDGSTDDTTAIQAASDRVEARGGGWVFFPKGTYKITSAVTIDTASVNWMGAGRAASVIKNFGTTTNAVIVNITGDSKLVLRDFAITCNTSSSGAGISVSSGDKLIVQDVSVALHRTGIHTASVTGARIINCFVESTDDNASAVGLSMGVRGRADNCSVVSGTTNGTGVLLSGTGAVAVDCYIEKFSGGMNLTGAGAQARSCYAASATTGYTLGAANVLCISCAADTCTTGYSVGAFARCGVPFSRATGCTTDLTVNTSATFFDDRGHGLAGTLTYNAATPATLPWRMQSVTTTTITGTASVTPDISGGKNLQFINLNTASAGQTVTLGAHSTATLAVGDMLWLLVAKKGANDATLAFNAQYVEADGTGTMSNITLTSGTANTWIVFVWSGSSFIVVTPAAIT